MPKLTERRGTFIIVLIGVIVIIAIALIQSAYPWEELRNEYTIIVEIIVGAIIAIITYTRTGRDAATIKQLIEKVNDYEEKQKQFLDKLELTRTARINFYGTKLVNDFGHIQRYFDNMEKLPKEKVEKLSPEFFMQYDILHAITLAFDNQRVEIPGRQFFEVMRDDLQVIESDLTPDVSYFVGQTLRLARITLVPMWQEVRPNTQQWNFAKTNVKTAIERLESVITEKKAAKEYGVILYRNHGEVRL